MVFGLDIGTTSVGAVALDETGRLVASATRVHEADVAGLGEGVDEQDPAKLLAAAKLALADVGGTLEGTIGWTGQMHGVVGVDRNLAPVTRFVTWRDARRFAGNVMAGWAKEALAIAGCLTAPGFVRAQLTGVCAIDETFLHSWHVDGCDFPRTWLPATEEGWLLGDNQAGVYGARAQVLAAGRDCAPDQLGASCAAGVAVVNLGTSGQLSLVGEGKGGERRPYPGGVLRCHASLVGGQAWSALRAKLGVTWEELNARADEPEVAACLAAIVDDLVGDLDLTGVATLVGVGNALRLNPSLRTAVERRFGLPCQLCDIPEMAAYGAARLVLETRATK